MFLFWVGSVPENPDGRIGFDAGDQREGAALRHGAILQLVREKGHDVRPNATVHYEAALATHRALFLLLRTGIQIKQQHQGEKPKQNKIKWNEMKRRGGGEI